MYEITKISVVILWSVCFKEWKIRFKGILPFWIYQMLYFILLLEIFACTNFRANSRKIPKMSEN